MMRVLALSAAGAVSAQNFSLTLLDLTRHPLAQCLDGSPGGFYFRPGFGSGASSYVVHTQGGGWCINEEDCRGRSATPLGSSKTWAAEGCPNAGAPVCTADGGAAGMLSSDPAINPDLYNANHIYIGYCDGGEATASARRSRSLNTRATPTQQDHCPPASTTLAPLHPHPTLPAASYAGTVYAPVNVSGTPLYFRGRFILDAIYDELLAPSGAFGMATAKEVIIKGCSAGGLAVYLHADYLAARVTAVSPGARVVAAPGAGFFLDVPSFGGGAGWPWGPYLYTPNYKYVAGMQNVSGSVNAACMAAYAPGGEGWKCFMAPYTLPFLKTPTFVSNSLFDAWQAGNVMGLGCNPTQASSCSPTQLVYWNSFRVWMLSALSPVSAPGSPHGGFLQACDVHVVEDIDHSWNGVSVAGQTQAETWAAWFYGAQRPGLPLALDGPWNGTRGNPTC